MKPLNRPYENRQEANGESMIPVDRQPTDTLRTRIAKAISDELFVRDAYTEYGTDDEPGQWERVDGHINLTALTDAVIRELRPQLAAWAQTCVDSGDMTPAAQRELHKILGSKHDRH